MFEEFKKLLIDELQIDPDKITMTSELSNDLGINSIELAELVMNCEESFHIDIQEEDIRNFVTVGDVVKYIESKTA
jgi:acyl carrier protein